jgi:glycosyltransferase involved in cell wall biosynthesis
MMARSGKTTKVGYYSTSLEDKYTKPKRKILYIHPISGSGGALSALIRILNKLDKTRFCMKVICPGPGSSYDLLINQGFNVAIERGIKTFHHHVCGWRSLRFIHKMVIEFVGIFVSAFFTYRLAIRERPDFIHLGSGALLGSALGAKIAGVPVVWHIREHLADGYFGIRKRIIANYIDFLSDKVIAIRESEARRLKKTKKLRVIYDCVDFDEFDRKINGDAFRKEFKLNEEDRCVATFGAVTHYKGSLQFVQAATSILKSHNNIRFFLFGPIRRPSKGTFLGKIKFTVGQFLYKKYYGYVDRIEELISEDNKNKILIAGNRHDVPRIMAGIDLVVFPSTLPHSALPIMEAGAMAKPVVASKWGEHDELVLNGITGLLVTPGNSEDLAKAIVEIVDSPERARKMGEEGYKRAKKLFNADKNIVDLMRIYDEILG